MNLGRRAVFTLALTATAFASIVGSRDLGPPAKNSVTVYMPAFSGPRASALGLNASTVINLAVWKTLRRAPYPNPNNLSFGNGAVLWDHRSLADRMQETGLSAAGVTRASGAQLFVDGDAFAYGPGAVVTARLYVLTPAPQDTSQQVWKVSVRFIHDVVELSSDVLPEREFEFRSIVLRGDDLEAFSSPALLEIHKDSPNGPVIGRVGDTFIAVRQESKFAEIRTPAGLHGFLNTPPTRPEIVSMTNFIGGVIRLLRDDWSGAQILLLDGVSSESLPVTLSVDALLMAAYCREQQNADGMELVDKAVLLSPSAPRVVKYRVMVVLSEISRRLRGRDTAGAAALIPVLQVAINNAVLTFGAEDSWVREAVVIANRLERLRAK
jgi:hypothetical protein